MNRIALTTIALIASVYAANAAAADPVADSFARMLGHQPHHGATATAQHSERDPLIAAVVLPLLREQVVERRLAGTVRRGAN